MDHLSFIAPRPWSFVSHLTVLLFYYQARHQAIWLSFFTLCEQRLFPHDGFRICHWTHGGKFCCFLFWGYIRLLSWIAIMNLSKGGSTHLWFLSFWIHYLNFRYADRSACSPVYCPSYSWSCTLQVMFSIFFCDASWEQLIAQYMANTTCLYDVYWSGQASLTIS